jgi:hypothetical protein
MFRTKHMLSLLFLGLFILLLPPPIFGGPGPRSDH